MFELLRQRRSIRKFQERPVELDKQELLCEALLRSPSSRDLRPWQFVLVDQRELLDQLATAKAHGTSFFSTAPLAVVLAADPRCCDVWIEDCAIAAIIVQLAAEQLGLKSCWAQLRLRPRPGSPSASEYVRQLLGLPDGYEVPMAIAIGYPDETKAGHPELALPRERLHRNRYSAG